MFHALLLLADEAPKAAPTNGPPAGLEMILFLALPLALYLLLMRPGHKRQEQEKAALLATLTKNDKVLTTAGIYGVVASVSDTEDEVSVRVDDNTRLRMLKSCIARNLTNEETAKAEKAAKETKKVGPA